MGPGKTNVITQEVQSKMKEQSQLRSLPVKPKEAEGPSMRMSWSTESKAALSSNKMQEGDLGSVRSIVAV